MVRLQDLLIRVFPKPREEGEVNVSHQYEGKDKIVAALCYLYLVSAAVLLIRKDNSEFVRFHARQALVLSLIALLSALLAPSTWKVLVNLAVLLLLLYGSLRALQGYRWNFPYLTYIANTIPL